MDWKQVREDVRRFVKSNELPSWELWSAEFFLAQAAKLASAIFEIVEEPVKSVDTRNNSREGSHCLKPDLCIRAGRPFGGPYPSPFIDS